MTHTIFLVGARASGKTTIGQQLANKLNYSFSDSDSYIVNQAQQNIATIVERHGWDKFRELEGQALREITRPNAVISTGGGMILAESNRQWMKSHGIVIYLCANAELLAKRLTNDPNNEQRPSLTGQSIVEEIAQIIQDRDSLYRDAANYIIDANQPIDDILAFIIQQISQ